MEDTSVPVEVLVQEQQALMIEWVAAAARIKMNEQVYEDLKAQATAARLQVEACETEAAKLSAKISALWDTINHRKIAAYIKEATNG